MAKLIGYLETQKGSRVSRLDQRLIESRLETWEGCIVTRLKADGSFEVAIGAKGDSFPGQIVATGSVNDDNRHAKVEPFARTCAYPDDRFGEHDHFACQDAIDT